MPTSNPTRTSQVLKPDLRGVSEDLSHGSAITMMKMIKVTCSNPVPKHYTFETYEKQSLLTNSAPDVSDQFQAPAVLL